jgi:hypothetical protein
VTGRSAANASSGLRPFGAEPQDASQAKPLVPNAAMLALAERCEQALRSDRELDCLIHCAIKGWTVVYEGVNVFADMGPTMRRMLVGWLDPGKVQRNFSMTSDSLAPNYTASIDAAMTLASGFGGEVTFFRDGTAKAFLWQPYPLAIEAKATSPALALCATALRARAASRIDARRGETGTGSISEADESLTAASGDAQNTTEATNGN